MLYVVVYNGLWDSERKRISRKMGNLGKLYDSSCSSIGQCSLTVADLLQMMWDKLEERDSGSLSHS